MQGTRRWRSSPRGPGESALPAQVRRGSLRQLPLPGSPGSEDRLSNRHTTCALTQQWQTVGVARKAALGTGLPEQWGGAAAAGLGSIKERDESHLPGGRICGAVGSAGQIRPERYDPPARPLPGTARARARIRESRTRREP